MVVRRGALEDLDAVAALEAQALGPDAWSAGLLADDLAGLIPTTTVLVAERGGEVAGYAVLSLTDDVAELQRVAVGESYRRQGVAGLLLAAVAERARTGGAERLLLEVRETNVAARALYAAHGFTELARRPRYYRDGAPALVLEHPLLDR